jgi:hypothetical protein
VWDAHLGLEDQVIPQDPELLEIGSYGLSV